MADPTYRAAKAGEFFCSAGGKWYMCETGTKFVGCCTSDPCTNGCHGNSLRPAGRSTALDSQSPGGSCGGQTPFWTCEQAPTFWGCCNEDPCMNNSTCPDGKLEPTYWDRPDQYEYFKDLNILLSSTAPRSTSSSVSSASSTSGSSNRRAVIGGAVGGTLGFLALVGVVVFLLWRRRRARRSAGDGVEEDSVGGRKPVAAGELASPVSAGTAPPTYSWSPTAPPHNHNHNASPSIPGPGEISGEVSGEDAKHSPRSPFTELHSKGSLARIAELPGAPAAGELDTPALSGKGFEKGGKKV